MLSAEKQEQSAWDSPAGPQSREQVNTTQRNITDTSQAVQKTSVEGHDKVAQLGPRSQSTMKQQTKSFFLACAICKVWVGVCVTQHMLPPPLAPAQQTKSQQQQQHDYHRNTAGSSSCMKHAPAAACRALPTTAHIVEGVSVCSSAACSTDITCHTAH